MDPLTDINEAITAMKNNVGMSGPTCYYVTALQMENLTHMVRQIEIDRNAYAHELLQLRNKVGEAFACNAALGSSGMTRDEVMSRLIDQKRKLSDALWGVREVYAASGSGEGGLDQCADIAFKALKEVGAV